MSRESDGMPIQEHNGCEGDCRGCNWRELTVEEVADPHRVRWDDYVRREDHDARVQEFREAVAVREDEIHGLLARVQALESKLAALIEAGDAARSLLSEGHGGIDEHDGCSDCAALHLLRGMGDASR